MTGYTVNTGSSEKFSTGWDKVFTKSTKKADDKKGKKKTDDKFVYVDKSKGGAPPLGKK